MWRNRSQSNIVKSTQQKNEPPPPPAVAAQRARSNRQRNLLKLGQQQSWEYPKKSKQEAAPSAPPKPQRFPNAHAQHSSPPPPSPFPPTNNVEVDVPQFDQYSSSAYSRGGFQRRSSTPQTPPHTKPVMPVPVRTSPVSSPRDKPIKPAKPPKSSRGFTMPRQKSASRAPRPVINRPKHQHYNHQDASPPQAPIHRSGDEFGDDFQRDKQRHAANGEALKPPSRLARRRRSSLPDIASLKKAASLKLDEKNTTPSTGFQKPTPPNQSSNVSTLGLSAATALHLRRDDSLANVLPPPPEEAAPPDEQYMSMVASNRNYIQTYPQNIHLRTSASNAFPSGASDEGALQQKECEEKIDKIQSQIKMLRDEQKRQSDTENFTRCIQIKKDIVELEMALSESQHKLKELQTKPIPPPPSVSATNQDHSTSGQEQDPDISKLKYKLKFLKSETKIAASEMNFEKCIALRQQTDKTEKELAQLKNSKSLQDSISSEHSQSSNIEETADQSPVPVLCIEIVLEGGGSIGTVEVQSDSLTLAEFRQKLVSDSVEAVPLDFTFLLEENVPVGKAQEPRNCIRHCLQDGKIHLREQTQKQREKQHRTVSGLPPPPPKSPKNNRQSMPEALEPDDFETIRDCGVSMVAPPMKKQVSVGHKIKKQSCGLPPPTIPNISMHMFSQQGRMKRSYSEQVLPSVRTPPIPDPPQIPSPPPETPPARASPADYTSAQTDAQIDGSASTSTNKKNVSVFLHDERHNHKKLTTISVEKSCTLDIFQEMVVKECAQQITDSNFSFVVSNALVCKEHYIYFLVPDEIFIVSADFKRHESHEQKAPGARTQHPKQYRRGPPISRFGKPRNRGARSVPIAKGSQISTDSEIQRVLEKRKHDREKAFQLAIN